MTSALTSTLALLLVFSVNAQTTPSAEEQPSDPLEAGFLRPPQNALPRCYWWWLNGNTDKATITHDLEEMKSKGFGGALLVDANGADQRGNRSVAAGPQFGSAAWRDLFRHALHEASRLSLELSLNAQSGWNLGGPGVRPEFSSKLLTWTRVRVTGPLQYHDVIEEPPSKLDYYRDIAVLFYPLHHGGPVAGEAGSARAPIKELKDKNGSQESGFSAPESVHLLLDSPEEKGEQDTNVDEVRDLTQQFHAGQPFSVDVPAGDWEILRIGYTPSDQQVSTSSDTWKGLAIDHMSRAAFDDYWNRTLVPVLEDARRVDGPPLKYLATDSWELGGTNWTDQFRSEFEYLRGYDPVRYLPIITGRILESRDASNRFLNDMRRTVGDLIAKNHYQYFAEKAREYGLGIHPESGGPHGAPIDSLQLLGISTFPQTEFWAVNPHRPKDADRFFLKEASSAAHVYGRNWVAAEAFTSIGPQWEESLWSNLKPSFDQAITEGLNLVFWHCFTSSPEAAGKPGQEYFAGTHLNPNVTWWEQAPAFLSYLSRVQFMMQQGTPVSDVLYFYGSQVPNFVQVKSKDPAEALPGYDYDVIDEQALLHRLTTRQGELLLPGGVRYRILVLPSSGIFSLAALKKVQELARAGASVVGPRPKHAMGLGESESEFESIVEDMWANCDGVDVRDRNYNRGHLYCQGTAREVLTAMEIPRDFDYHASDETVTLDYVHRRTAKADIYFVRNSKDHPVLAEAAFRVDARQPEIWKAETGEIQKLAIFDVATDGRMVLPLELPAYGSALVVFRNEPQEHVVKISKGDVPLFPLGTDVALAARERLPHLFWSKRTNGPVIEVREGGRFLVETSTGQQKAIDLSERPRSVEVPGPWHLAFPQGWGAPEHIELPQLQAWNEHPHPGVRYFSGSAVYSTDFAVPSTWTGRRRRIELQLTDVREIAEVRVNGKPLGILWQPPFAVEVTDVVESGSNHLEVRVTNLWPNRIIGDLQPDATERYTQTNITKFRANSRLLPSGLLGPVRLVEVPYAPLR